MYKISEVADKLGVEKVNIVEQMLLAKNLLERHVHKDNHITMIDEQGVKVLAKIFGKTYEEEVPSDLPVESKMPEQEKDDLEIVHQRIATLRASISKLEHDNRLKDDAIKNYLYLLKDDISWLTDHERKFFRDVEAILLESKLELQEGKTTSLLSRLREGWGDRSV